MDELLFFISYADEDADYKKWFIKHFKAAQKKNWQIWENAEIKAGDNWDDVTKSNLSKADVIILLVSADFLGTEYKQIVELKQALERHRENSALVVPVIVRDCVWNGDETGLKGIQPVVVHPRINDKEKDIDPALLYAVREVLKSVDAYQLRSATPAPADIKPGEIAELRQLDPDALLIVVRERQKLYLLPPNSADAGPSFSISEQWLPHRAFAIIQRLVAEGILDENEYEALGEAFYCRLFPQKQAQEAFKNLYLKHSAHRSEDNPLKIILHFDRASADLASLPWEYLWLPFEEDGKKGFFIGEKAELVLTRRLSVAGEKIVPLLPVEKIRILVAYSKPAKPAEEAAVIEGNAKQIEAQCQTIPNIEIKTQEIVSEAAFKKFIAENGPFQIVHFIGKSRMENDKKVPANEIALFEPAKKDPEWLSPQRFVQCFEEKDAKTKKPNLVFFNVIRDSTDHCGCLRETALQLIDQVDGILSIQTPVDSAQSAVFAEKLYAALGQGKDLDVAAAAAARQVAQHSHRLYGISAAYSRKTLRMELAKPPLAEDSIFMKCPNYDDSDIQCRQLLPVKNGRVTWTYCKNPKCDAGPLWLCPNCKAAVANLAIKRCLNCGFETANMSVPDEIRRLIPAPKTESSQAAKPPVPGTMTDRAAHGPQESRRSEPGLPK